MRTLLQSLLLFLPIVALTGCGSSTTPYKIAYKVVGKAVNESQVADLQKKLMGKPPAAATAELGQPVDTWRDTRSARRWLTYHVSMDPMDKYRYIVAVENDRVAALWKVERGGANELDIPRRLVLQEKVKGKNPREAQSALGMGAPLLTVKSETSGRLAQLYDARMVEVGKTYYCLLRFDTGQHCEDLDFVTVESGTQSQIH